MVYKEVYYFRCGCKYYAYLVGGEDNQETRKLVVETSPEGIEKRVSRLRSSSLVEICLINKGVDDLLVKYPGLKKKRDLVKETKSCTCP